MEIEQIICLLFSIAGLTGVFGLIWGVYQYRQSTIEKRKNILFELAKKFDTSEKMLYAKRILDDFNLEVEDDWDKKFGYYHKRNLLEILKSHYEEGVDDKGQVDIRHSFDAFFDFLERLTYLYNTGLVKEKELSYFTYFIERAKDETAIIKFCKTYGYKWVDGLSKKHKKFKFF